jgi:hypothetical protein
MWYTFNDIQRKDYAVHNKRHFALNFSNVRFQVLTAASIKITAFWNVAPCSLVDVYRRSEVLAASIIRAMSTSETSVNFYQTTRRNNPEDSHFRTLRRENLKSYTPNIDIVTHKVRGRRM